MFDFFFLKEDIIASCIEITYVIIPPKQYLKRMNGSFLNPYSK
jgi:hypothetical protein